VAPRLFGHPIFNRLPGYLYALILVAIVTAVLGGVLLVYTIEHVTILYLIPVLVAALYWGIGPALAAAISGIAASAFFFYPPIFDLRVQNPSQIIDLVLFIIVAVVTGQLALTTRQARSRAQAESLRNALIGSVSHELQTPLAAIVGSASILTGSEAVAADQQLAELVRVIRAGADRLNSDIQNLLDATRISSDGVRPHMEWVDLEDIVNGVLKRKQDALRNRQVSLSIADDLPLAYVDPSLMQSALGQIVENAAKYSNAPGPIAIAIEAAADGMTMQIKVIDQGEGLSLGEPERIFEQFYRSARHANTVPGSGLGLWIARALIEACCGRVRAFSVRVGQGTTMRIDLPIRPAPQPEADDA